MEETACERKVSGKELLISRQWQSSELNKFDLSLVSSTRSLIYLCSLLYTVPHAVYCIISILILPASQILWDLKCLLESQLRLQICLKPLPDSYNP